MSQRMKIISRESRTVHATLVFSYREGRASSGGGSKEGEKGDGRDLHVERELVGWLVGGKGNQRLRTIEED